MPFRSLTHGLTDAVHTGAKFVCSYVAICPGIVALVELIVVCCTLLVSLVSRPMQVEANFDSFATTDVESSILYETFSDARSLVATKSSRRLSTPLVVRDVILAYELQDAGVQDGLFNLKAQRAISKFERSMRGLEEWQALCSFSNVGDRVLCNPGLSFTNYILPTQVFEPGGLVPNELWLNGEGVSLLPLWAALWLIGKYALKSVMLPLDLLKTQHPARATVLRSVFRFRLQTAQHSAAVLRDRWRKFISDVLLPFFQENSDTDEFLSGGMAKVYYDASDLEEIEILDILKSDALFTIGSLTFVLFYVMLHTRSLILSLAGIFTSVLSLPCAYVVCSWLSDSTKISFASFLALFMIIGFGADVVFVYTDLWSDSIQHCSDDRSRLLWTLQHAGRASIITTAVTALSFLANLASLIRALRQLGLFMGLCVLFAWLFISLIYLPLCLFDERYSGRCRNKFGCLGTHGHRKRLFHSWSLHVYRRRWWYVILSAVASLFMLVMTIISLQIDNDTPQLFPDDHNRNAGNSVRSGFESLKDVLPSTFTPPATRIGVCSDIGVVESQTCELFWCDAYQVSQHACFRRVHLCSSFVGTPNATTRVISNLAQDGQRIIDHMRSVATAFSVVAASDGTIIGPHALLLQNWEEGQGLYGSIRDYNVQLYGTTAGSEQICGWQDICFEAGHACRLESPWQSIHHDVYFTGSTSAPRRLVSNPAKVRIIFGLEVNTKLFMLGHENFRSRWSFNPTFKLSHPWSQRHVHKFCNEYPSDLKVSQDWCWLKNFRTYLVDAQNRFPTVDFDTLALQFLNVYPTLKEYVWIEDGEIKGFYASNNVDVSKVVTDTSEILSYKQRWDEYVDNFNRDAFLFAQGAFHVSTLWVDAETPAALVASTAQTLISLFVLAFLGMLIFTCSLRLSLFVVLATVQVVCGLMFFAIVLMGWSLGVIETVALIYFMGYALTYSLHIAHKYGSSHVLDLDSDAFVAVASNMSQQIRLTRTSMALQTMGNATVGSATTTAGSAFFLLLCTLTVFMKLGCMCFVVALMSIVVALLPLPALLLLFAPTYEKRAGLTCCRSFRHLCSLRTVASKQESETSLPVGADPATCETIVAEMTPTTCEVDPYQPFDAPTTICICGVTDVNGRNTSMLNGSYELQPDEYNGKPCWRKQDDANKCLLWWPSGWFVNDFASKDSCGRTGVLWSGEDDKAVAPMDVSNWKVYDGNGWVPQSVLVKKVIDIGIVSPSTFRVPIGVCRGTAFQSSDGASSKKYVFNL